MTSPLFQRFRVHHLHTQAEAPPNRRFVVNVEMQNTGSVAGVLLNVWSEARLDPGGTLAAGALFEQRHVANQPAVVLVGGKIYGQFVVPISAEVLAAAERGRVDRVNLIITGKLLMAPVHGIPTVPSKVARGRSPSAAGAALQPILGAPFEVEACDASNYAMVVLPIPASEWIKHLRAWRWKEVELFELGLSSRSEPPQYGMVYGILRQAEQSFLDHDYDGTLSHCRRSLESMAKTAGDGDVKTGYAALASGRFGGPLMTANFDTLVKALNTFSHAGRHAASPHETVTRDDALLVLRSTLAIIERLTR